MPLQQLTTNKINISQGDSLTPVAGGSCAGE